MNSLQNDVKFDYVFVDEKGFEEYQSKGKAKSFTGMLKLFAKYKSENFEKIELVGEADYKPAVPVVKVAENKVGSGQGKKISEYLHGRGIDWHTIKALSVKQPWASKIATGEKTIEWRSKPIK